MNILQVIPYFSPNRGGDVKVCHDLSKLLIGKGHKVTIATTDFEFDEEYAESITKEGGTVVPFRCVSDTFLFLVSPGMKTWLRNNLAKYDLAHLHDFRSYQNNITHRYSRILSIPYVLQAHGSLAPIYAKRWLKKTYDLVWGHSLIEDASRLFALANAEAAQYVQMGASESDVAVVPNGIFFSDYESLPARGLFRQEYGIDKNDKLILYLGRIHHIKRVDRLIKSVSNMKEQMPNIKLAVVGPDHGSKTDLERLARNLGVSDRILFAGPLFGDRKSEAYVDADVYVLPSDFEAFPVTVLEACACGTPSIVGRNCMIADLIDGKAGFSVDLETNELEERILRILNDRKLAKTFGDNGRNLVRERFDLIRLIDTVENEYRHVVSDKTKVLGADAVHE